MSKNIKLLEDRVSQVVGRLKAISSEREQLQEELREMGERLRSMEAEAASAGKAKDAVDRDRVIAAVRDALSELRAD